MKEADDELLDDWDKFKEAFRLRFPMQQKQDLLPDALAKFYNLKQSKRSLKEYFEETRYIQAHLPKKLHTQLAEKTVAGLDDEMVRRVTAGILGKGKKSIEEVLETIQSTTGSAQESDNSIPSPNHPASSSYYYDEPVPTYTLEKGNGSHTFPPTSLDLSDAWVSKIVQSDLKREERNSRYPAVFSSKYLAAIYKNKGAPAIHLDSRGEWRYDVVFGKFQLHGQEGVDAGLAVRDNRKKLTTKRHIGDGVLRVKKTTDAATTEQLKKTDAATAETTNAATAERMDRDNTWTENFVKELSAEVAKNESEDTTAGKKHPRDKDTDNVNERLPKYPKTRIQVDDLSMEVTRLERQISVMNKVLQYADTKIMESVRFGSHQDSIVAFMAGKFREWKSDATYHARTKIEMDMNAAIQSSDAAVAQISKEFPELEGLLSDHPDGLKPTIALEHWMLQQNHIQYQDTHDDNPGS